MKRWKQMFKFQRSRLTISEYILKKRLRKIKLNKALFEGKPVMELKIVRNGKKIGTFSDKNTEIPLKVEGELLRPGEYYVGSISEGELKKAFNKLKDYGEDILLFSTHEAYWGDTGNVNYLLGRLINFSWDEKNSAIMFDGEVYNREMAGMINAGVVRGISPGFLFDTEGKQSKEIDIREATITFRPHCKSANIKPKGESA